MTGSEILNIVLKETGESYNSLASNIGVKRTQNLYDIRDGKVKKISFALATLITAKYPNFDIDWLQTGKGEKYKPTPPVIEEAEVLHQNKTIQNLSEAFLKLTSSHEIVAQTNRELVEGNKKILDRILTSLDALAQASTPGIQIEQSSEGIERLALLDNTKPPPPSGKPGKQKDKSLSKGS